MSDLTPFQATVSFPNVKKKNAIYARFGKRGFDLILSLIMLIPAFFVIGLLWVMVRLDGGPGFFGHARIGRDGKRFVCWKIRTMRPDAEAALSDLLTHDADAASEWEETRKITNDPRITKLGAFLRKSSLDELPQIVNVLIGDMSLVGPRPVPQDELALYGIHRGSYLGLRPGVTGLWQVSGRNAVQYDDRVRLDVQYARSLSIWADAVILLRTVRCVLGRSGM